MKQAILEMFKALPGGKYSACGVLGYSENDLDNRLYQRKGQRFTECELITIEAEFGVSHWSDEVAQRLGKAMIAIPNIDELDSVEISALQLKELAARGLFFATLENFLADGVLTTVEINALRKLLHKAQSSTAQILESTIGLYSQQ
ncbi:hypothetical protein E4T80_03115 [Muribacter muris]|uniref:Uncharacterized protein n=1 Tax=Muribacter muris TaxID=67855 RepID=A0A4Y9K4B0_9PAST|nr:YmfL family putative regulatory protein [Muribacter muris]MBF0784465.1 hypothetical protein [Muribacter muris]MBF0826239.1 hypothetical protein [Muribacter muris]TFV11979.1 hypothetical protein E4T80_03115 [Muribacter muris]